MIQWERFGQKAIDFIRTPLENQPRITMLEGSVRSGKTVACHPWVINYIQNGPKGLFLFGGVSKQTIKQNVLNDLFDLVGTSNYRYNKQTGEMKLFDRDCIVVGFKDEGSEKFIRGVTLAGALLDEATMFPQSSFLQILNRLSVENSKLVATMNPDSPFHYIKTDFIDNQALISDGTIRSIHFTLNDNPALSDEYKEFIRSAYSGLWYKRMILGQWVQAEGAIFDMFSEKRHVVTITQLPEQFDRIIVGVDYGAGNPTVFGMNGITHDNQGRPHVWLIDEYYHDPRKSGAKTARQYKQDFIDFIGETYVNAIYPDPSALDFINELESSSCGVAYTNIGRTKNAVLPGINSVASMMEQGRWHVCCERCPETLKEVVSYIWDEKAQRRGEDKPLKENDHCMDGAVRYPIHSEFPAVSRERVFLNATA